MSARTAIKAQFARWLTSQTRIDLRRRLGQARRRLRGTDREILYFHRADDPYCQLMVQILPEFMERYGITIKPLVIERLPAAMYPAPTRYEAYSIIDAARLGNLYGVGFPANATVPDPLSVRMVTNYLTEHQDSDEFYRLAADIGSALWRRGIMQLQEICGDALIYNEEQLRLNERKLAELGQYTSGTIAYEGEVYVGLDRLDHLEERLLQEGLGDGEAHYDLTKRWMLEVVDDPVDADNHTIEMYFSVRSPFSYIALQKLQYLQHHTGCDVVLKPLLPMVNRGMKVPKRKFHYIVSDAAREAYESDIAFGKVVDPLGKAARRGLAIGLEAIKLGKGLEFFIAFTRAHWAEGRDTSKESVMNDILDEAGVPIMLAREALKGVAWKKQLEENRVEMERYGLWGVPVLRHENKTYWGQDRIFPIVQGFRKS